MKMEQLEYFGIPDYIIKIWKDHYSDFLLPIQEKAIKEFDLLQSGKYIPYNSSAYHSNISISKNLLVISPSSSGKTLIGEIAALGEIYSQKKVIFLVPLRILAEEKYLHFVKLYHSTGLNVRFSSRDHRNHDRDIIQGNFNIAIIVYEKFYYLLQQHPQFFNNVSLVIADEIQLICDIQRGPRLEINLKYLKNNYPGVRIIGLSAFTEHLLALTAWLGASLIFSSYRPVELRKGIVRKGLFKYIEHNSKITGEENFFSKEEAEECNLASYLKATLYFLIKQNESNLIFFPSKNEIRMWSRWLSTQLNLTPSKNAINILHNSENSTSKEELLHLLHNGIGYHSADLSRQERYAVEEAVRVGDLKIVFATDTLSAGVNLPVNNVILTGQKIVSQNNGNIYNNFCRRNLTISEVENMGGRAGRLKGNKSFGRIIFLAPSPIEFTTYQRLYFTKNNEKSPVATLNDYSIILKEGSPTPYLRNNKTDESAITDDTNSFNSYQTYQLKIIDADSDISISHSAPVGIADSNPTIAQNDILTFLLYKIALDGCSFEVLSKILSKEEYKEKQSFWLYQFSQKYNEEDLITSLKCLAESGLISLSSNYEPRITDSGKIIISKGITFQTYNTFLKWVRESEKDCISKLEVLFLIANSDDGAVYFTDFTNKNFRTSGNSRVRITKWKKYLHMRLLNLVFQEQEEEKLIFRDKLNISTFQSNQKNLKINTSIYSAIKNTLVMYDWINDRELVEMEEDYGILGGGIQKMGEGFSWLVDTLSVIAEREGWKEDRLDDLKKIKLLSIQLIYGVGSECIPLARLNIPNLSRFYIHRLVREGYCTIQCLEELSDNQLKQFLPDLLVKEIKKYLTSEAYYPNLESGPLVEICKNNNRSMGKDPAEIFKQNTYDKTAENTISETPENKQKKSENKRTELIIKININRPDQISFLDENIAVNKIGFQLISLLAFNKGKLLSYDEIIDKLWPSDEDATYHRLWYHLSKLRKEMTKIILKKSKHMENILPAETYDYLKEKILKVFPGRGLMLDAEMIIEWIE